MSGYDYRRDAVQFALQNVFGLTLLVLAVVIWVTR